MSQQKEIGTLVVVVLKAQHLHQPSFYKQDPYAQVSLSGLKKRTRVDPKGGQHPVWDDELRFPVLADAGKDKVNRIVEISCYKDEQRGDDIFLGKGMVDIEETLKTGEFDDWILLETSAGARGEVYLEMTFYANSPPPLTRRPSKLSPSDRLVRPAAYFKKGRQLSPTSTSPSTQSGRSPVLGEKKPSQLPSIGANQIPLSLIPAHGSQTQASKQAPSSQATTSTVTTKQKDTLPPLPADDPTDVDSGKKLGVPTILHPGGPSGPRPMLPQNQNRVASVGRPSLETLPQELHKRAVSDTSALAPSFSRLQVPVQSYSLETTSITRPRIGSTPSIVVEQHEDHPPFVLSTPLVTLPSATQGHEPRGVYAIGDYDSFTYRPPDQVYLQPNSQGYTSCPTQGYPRTFSPLQHPVPLPPRTPPGQPQQLYDASPAMTSPPSLYQQYAPVPGGPPTPQPFPPPQMYSQLHSSQPQHMLYPSQPQQNPPLSQQPYIPPQQQKYHPQLPPNSQTPHPPSVPQSYQQPNHPGLPASIQSPAAAQKQQPPYSQTPQQLYLTVPPPPSPVQPQTPEPYASQLSHRQLQSYILPPPPPPPPPPPLHNQGGKTTSNTVSVTQPLQTSASAPSQGPISPQVSLPPSGTPVTPLLRSSTTLPLQVVANVAPDSSTEEVVTQKQVEEGENTTKPAAVAEVGTVFWEEARGSPKDVVKNQENEEQDNEIAEEELGQPLKDMEEQGAREERERKQRLEEEDRQRDEEVRKQEENRNRQEAERRRWEEEEQRKREEEEHQRLEGEERRKREEEECLKRDEEERKRREDEERREKEEEERREMEEEERRKREKEEGRRREEEQKRRKEEEHRRREEEERRRQEEERIQHEREEAERYRIAAEEEARRRHAEEAEAERRWQAELVRIRARAEQEAADAAFARAQMEAEEAERRRQEEADLVVVRQVQEEAEREERLAQERRRQEEADREVAKREQAHEEELERRREEETRRRIEEADRELARRLDMELNLGVEDQPGSRQRRTPRNGQH